MKIKDSEIREILKKYDVGELKKKKLIYDFFNYIYKIKTTKGNFIFKIMRFDSKKNLDSELRILNVLSKEIPHSLPIKSRDGRFYLNWKLHQVLIAPFLDGKPEKIGHNLPETALRELGRYCALIHKTRNINGIKKKNLYSYLKAFFDRFDKNSREVKLAKKIFRILEKSRFNEVSLPSGLIHGDLHTENILVKNGSLTYVMDFEDSYVGDFVNDLALIVIDTCVDGNGKLSRKRLSKLLSSYEKIRKLTKLERKYLRGSMLLIGIYALHFLMMLNGINNRKNFNNYFIRKYIRMLKVLGI